MSARVEISTQPPAVVEITDASSGVVVVASEVASPFAVAAQAAAAEAQAAHDSLLGVYYGAFASAPVTDPLGNPPDVGDLYYDTTAGALMAWDGSAWGPLPTSAANDARYLIKEAGAGRQELRNDVDVEDDAGLVLARLGRQASGLRIYAGDGLGGIDADNFFEVKAGVRPRARGGLTVEQQDGSRLLHMERLDKGHALAAYLDGSGNTLLRTGPDEVGGVNSAVIEPAGSAVGFPNTILTKEKLQGVGLPQADWDAGTSTTEAVVSPAKLAGALSALATGFDPEDVTELAAFPTRKYNGTITLSEPMTNFHMIGITMTHSSYSSQPRSFTWYPVSEVQSGRMGVTINHRGAWALWEYTDDVTLTYVAENASWIHGVYGIGRK